MLDAVTRQLVSLALDEDIGPGDVTARLVPEGSTGKALIQAKSDLIFSGGDVFIEVYRQLDPLVEVRIHAGEGAPIAAGNSVGDVFGPSRSILTGERTALNFLQRACGIATFTRRAVDAVAGTNARVVDTRKTTPGLRSIDKRAVRAGGGHNHRFGLFDGVMIKDNHVAAVGSVSAAIAEARRLSHHLLKIECEVDTLDQLEEALAAGADVVLLDNMSTVDIAEAVRRTRGRALLEASGGMDLARLPEVAATGVDLISMGALTHSVRAADISLEWIA